MFKNTIDPKDCVVLFADLQQGVVELVRTVPRERLGRSVRGLAKLAKVFEMLVIVSAVPAGDGQGATVIPEIASGYGAYPIYYRSTANSLLDQDIVDAIRKSGRKTLLIAGVATELAVQLPALVAQELGFRPVVVVDACGGISARTEEAALARIRQAGATTTSVMTLAGELAGDFREPLAQAAMSVLFEMAAD